PLACLLFALVRVPPTLLLCPYPTLFRSGRSSQWKSPIASWGFLTRSRDTRPDFWAYRSICPRFRRNNWPTSPRGSTAAAMCLNRSEEHTSELQSREKLVCRLLREKKKSK